MPYGNTSKPYDGSAEYGGWGATYDDAFADDTNYNYRSDDEGDYGGGVPTDPSATGDDEGGGGGLPPQAPHQTLIAHQYPILLLIQMLTYQLWVVAQ